MNILLILGIIIALIIIIILLILYKGVKLSLLLQKKEAQLNYNLIISIFSLPVFKRSNEDKSDEDNEDDDEDNENGEENEQDEDADEEDKGIKKKYNEIKAILKKLKECKPYLKPFIKHLLRSLDFKKISGFLKIGLNDHTKTVKIASFIWSVGAIVNTVSKPTSLIVEPTFTEEVIDIDMELELKINLLTILIQTIILLTKREIRELIEMILDYRKSE